MAKLFWAVLCRRVITDRETNLVTYVDVVEGLTVAQAPPLPFPPLYLGTTWLLDPEEQALRIQVHVVAPSGASVYAFQLPEVARKSPRHRVNVQLSGFNVEEVGEFEIVVEQFTGDEWRTEAKIPFDISPNP